MTKEMMKKETNLPASVVAMQGLVNSVAAIGAGSGGEQFMKMTKFGEFVFGAEDLEIEDDSMWAVNPTQFTHGWICWGTEDYGTDGKVQGEVMAPASGPLPEKDRLPEAKGQWTKQVGIQLRCLNGADEGIQCIFKTNSLGGKKAYTALVSAVVNEINARSEYVCPVVKLTAKHYIHKKFGKIFTPEFEILDWMTMDGLAETEEGTETETETEEPVRRVRKNRAEKRETKKAQVNEPDETEYEEEDEEEEEVQPPPRRRRRRS